MSSMHAPVTKEVGITKPIPFDGDQAKVKQFIQECNVYLDINEDIYKNDKLKVAFILSLMSEKEAFIWRGHYINSITDKQMKITYPTFAKFLLKLDKDFKPTDMAGEAMNKLELLRQGNRPVEKLITEFRALAQEAELEDKTNADNRHMIKLFAACINPQLKKRILFGEVVPKTYEGWVDKAIQFDSNYRMGQALMDIDGAKGRRAIKPSKEKDPNAMDTSIGAMTEKE